MFFKKLFKNFLSIFLIGVLSFQFLAVPQQTDAMAQDIVAGIAMCIGGLAASVVAAGAVEHAIGQVGKTFEGTGRQPPGSAASIADVKSKLAAGPLWKECVLDPAINAAKNAMIAEILETVLGQVNHGRDGGPAYVKNFEDYFRESFDRKFGEIIYNSDLGFLCEGFELPLKFALQMSFYGRGVGIDGIRESKCTLSEIEQNIDSAVSDVVGHYRWGNFFDIMVNTEQNNIFGVYFKTNKDLRRAIGRENQKKKDDVNRGSGFMSLKECDSRDANTPATADEASCVANCGPVILLTYNDCVTACRTTIQFGSIGVDDHCKITTPGKLLQEGINTALGTEITSLQLADEFDEIFTALIGALMTRAFSKGGLASASTLNHNRYNPSVTLMSRNIVNAIPSQAEMKVTLNELERISYYRTVILKYMIDFYEQTGPCWAERTGWEMRGNFFNSNIDIAGDVILRYGHTFDRLMESLRVSEEQRWNVTRMSLDPNYLKLKAIQDIALKNLAIVQCHKYNIHNTNIYDQARREIENATSAYELFKLRDKYSGLIDTAQLEIMQVTLSEEYRQLKSLFETLNNLTNSSQLCKDFKRETNRIKDALRDADGNYQITDYHNLFFDFDYDEWDNNNQNNDFGYPLVNFNNITSVGTTQRNLSINIDNIRNNSNFIDSNRSISSVTNYPQNYQFNCAILLDLETDTSHFNYDTESRFRGVVETAMMY